GGESQPVMLKRLPDGGERRRIVEPDRSLRFQGGIDRRGAVLASEEVPGHFAGAAPGQACFEKVEQQLRGRMSIHLVAPPRSARRGTRQPGAGGSGLRDTGW